MRQGSPKPLYKHTGVMCACLWGAGKGVKHDQPRKQILYISSCNLYIGKNEQIQGPMKSSLNCISGIIFDKLENLISWSVLIELKLILLISQQNVAGIKSPL